MVNQMDGLRSSGFDRSTPITQPPLHSHLRALSRINPTPHRRCLLKFTPQSPFM
jgi:hypothetical protein